MSPQSTDCLICKGKTVFKEYCRKENYLLLRCETCNFIFVPEESLTGISLNDFYNQNYLRNSSGGGYVDYELDKVPMRPVYEKLLQTVQTLGSGESLLDIGTASGYFLDIASNYGYKSSGIDINLSAVREGLGLGRNIKHGDLFTHDFEDSSVDVITALDFIEHLPYNQVNLFLKKVRTALSEKGIFVLITVNTGSLWARFWQTNWHTLLPPEHLSYFSDRNIKLLLENNGFKVLKIKTLHKFFSLQYIFSILYRWQKLSLWKSLTKFLEFNPLLGRIKLKISIGDNVLIVARKI